LKIRGEAYTAASTGTVQACRGLESAGVLGPCPLRAEVP